MLFDYFIYLFMFLLGLGVFCSVHKHLLLTLLSLEYLVLIMFLVFFKYLLLSGWGGGYFILIFLTFSVCEGSLGLGVLVSMIRCHGNDNLNSLSLMLW
uniref:NADH-ubiquinone oxidoreductase chain 4L n=1 Tax=Coleoptera sp. 1 KM-2017 TaxID=2219312 RepID=A0A346RG68_9COLE|nr:NADH dehydrogenase subunit 4L [Coleoptera sp. 1 KM-2017]